MFSSDTDAPRCQTPPSTVQLGVQESCVECTRPFYLAVQFAQSCKRALSEVADFECYPSSDTPLRIRAAGRRKYIYVIVCMPAPVTRCASHAGACVKSSKSDCEKGGPEKHGNQGLNLHAKNRRRLYMCARQGCPGGLTSEVFVRGWCVGCGCFLWFGLPSLQLCTVVPKQDHKLMITNSC